MSLAENAGIAGAVAAEIRRIENHPDLAASEGAAYKGALYRMGRVDPLQLCADFEADCLVSAACVRGGARGLALLELRRGSVWCNGTRPL